MLAGAASATTLALTEGTRDLVADTTRIAGPDSPSDFDGFNLGSIGFGGDDFNNIDIHGRIVGQADTFNFTRHLGSGLILSLVI